jgi:hypothetical protein
VLQTSGFVPKNTTITADVSEEHIASIIRVERISEVGTTLAITTEAHCEEMLTPVLTRASWRHMSEDGILHSHYVKTSNLTKKFICRRRMP